MSTHEQLVFSSWAEAAFAYKAQTAGLREGKVTFVFINTRGSGMAVLQGIEEHPRGSRVKEVAICTGMQGKKGDRVFARYVLQYYLHYRFNWAKGKKNEDFRDLKIPVTIKSGLLGKDDLEEKRVCKGGADRQSALVQGQEVLQDMGLVLPLYIYPAPPRRRCDQLKMVLLGITQQTGMTQSESFESFEVAKVRAMRYSKEQVIAKQPQFPQPLLIRLVVQTLCKLHWSSLDTLQHLSVFLVVRGPKPNTVFEVRPHQCRVQGHDHFPSPAGHTISDTSQDAIGLLGHLGTLLAHIERAVDQHSQDCLPRDSVNQAPKQAKVCPPEVQGGSSADPPPYFSKNQKLYHFMIAMPKTASNHHITHKAFSVPKQQLQRGTFPCWLTHQLCQEVICPTPQEPPRVFPLCSIVFPADTCLLPGTIHLHHEEVPHAAQSCFTQKEDRTYQKDLRGQAGEVFHPSDHFCGPPLDPFQQLHVFHVLRTPELDAVLQVESHQSRVEGQNHLPRPAGHASFDADQDTVGLPGCKRTLLAHVQLFIHQYPQGLLQRAALNPFIPQPILIPRVVPTQVQDPVLGVVEPYKGHMGPLLELVQVPLDGIPSLRHVNHTTQLGVICKLAEGALDPTVYVIVADIKQYWCQYEPLRDTAYH
ncbi:hypothetical protein QYF61_003156 [Mycteria americana]|uniref:Uncharacterized protein n=1 Tax=Mycteria americana TaxID=33587 RepID=A0AAN7NID6_MYCAM|nr:hypothetical protein QYF61_003156 [Mycteria americana]